MFRDEIPVRRPPGVRRELLRQIRAHTRHGWPHRSEGRAGVQEVYNAGVRQYEDRARRYQISTGLNRDPGQRQVLLRG